MLFPVLQVIILRFINPPVSTMMVYQSFERLFSGESMGFSHTNISWDEMPDSFIQSVVAAEDQKFYSHNGFDWTEIEKAQKDHARHPTRPMRGASTISQQTAKNLFLPPWHLMIRKGVEAYYTFLMEHLWSKQRIIETYANIVELAPGIYGIEAGAQYHFHKHASQLSAGESAYLASVLPNPQRWSASKPTPYIQRRAARIMRQSRGLPADEDEDGEPD
jgi:monofunctional biosynthetic peptidoglycan transglycosylase